MLLPGRFRLPAVVFRAGELSAHLIGLGRAELSEEHKGLLPVTVSPTGLTGRLVTASEAVVSAGLLVLVADLGGQAERECVLSANVDGLARSEKAFTKAVEGLGLSVLVADLTKQRQGLPVAADGLMMAAQPRRDIAEGGESLGFAVPVTILTGQGQGPLEVISALLVAA